MYRYFNSAKCNNGKLTLKIINAIGKPSWWEDTTSFKDVLNYLDGFGKVDEIEVVINSPGGSVTEGVAIYEALKQHPAPVTVKIIGECCSIASVVAMAGDTIKMANTALFMIHDPSAFMGGKAKDLRKVASVLDMMKENIINAYTSKTKLTREALATLMSEETFMTAKEALDKGFITEIIDHSPIDIVNSRVSSVIENYRFTNEKVSENKISETKNQGGKMTKEEFLNSNPDMYKAILEEGAKNERARLEALDKLQAAPANNAKTLEIINKAKYENIATATDIMQEVFANLGTVTDTKVEGTTGENKAEAGINFAKVKEIVNQEIGEIGGQNANDTEAENLAATINEIVDISNM